MKGHVRDVRHFLLLDERFDDSPPHCPDGVPVDDD